MKTLESKGGNPQPMKVLRRKVPLPKLVDHVRRALDDLGKNPFMMQGDQTSLTGNGQVSLGKKLLVEAAIITVATTFAFAAPALIKAAENNSVEQQAEVREVSIEKTVIIDNLRGVLKVEQVDDNEIRIYFGGKLLSDVDLTPNIEKYFGGKVTIQEILIGNPSPLIRVVDADGNCGWILIVNDTPVPFTSKFPAGKTKVKENYDENKGEYQVTIYDADGRILNFFKVSNTGKLVIAAPSQK